SADAVAGNGRPLSWAPSADAVAGRGDIKPRIAPPRKGGGDGERSRTNTSGGRSESDTGSYRQCTDNQPHRASPPWAPTGNAQSRDSSRWHALPCSPDSPVKTPG